MHTKRPSTDPDKETISQHRAIEKIYPYELSQRDPSLLNCPTEVVRARHRVRQKIEYAAKTGALKSVKGAPKTYDRKKFERWAKLAWLGVNGGPGPGERAFALPRHPVVPSSPRRFRPLPYGRTLYLPLTSDGMEKARARIAELEQQNRDLTERRSRVEKERDDLVAGREAERQGWLKREAELFAEVEKRAPDRVIRRLRRETQKKRS